MRAVEELGDHDIACLGDVQDIPVGLRPGARESANEVLDLAASLDRPGGHVVVDAVLGEVGGELRGVEPRPRIAEILDHVRIAGHCEFFK